MVKKGLNAWWGGVLEAEDGGVQAWVHTKPSMASSAKLMNPRDNLPEKHHCLLCNIALMKKARTWNTPIELINKIYQCALAYIYLQLLRVLQSFRSCPKLPYIFFLKQTDGMQCKSQKSYMQKTKLH
ncbi:uncharacterized protein LOC120270375 [Dioscorea cayenensis subsp. rotundata]|uniref:Uncharacterized protein LOC120270375 n=1 Tax=Dioscorea cayennensis subsp. rotundata TaxID=55577 RepID=A0AB40C0P3_DIOCR|nr:uncharacterized protein LOC120270375 [Dioscorea cayenensis subsp. rotundata]